MDIELRWLVDDSLVSNNSTLQFRVEDKHIDSPTTNPLPSEWGDWKEVPVEYKP